MPAFTLGSGDQIGATMPLAGSSSDKVFLAGQTLNEAAVAAVTLSNGLFV